MTPEDFISAIGKAAQASAAKTSVPASFTVAQAALESGWGSSGLAVQGKNLFGIKADDSWGGNVIVMNTREYINHEWVMVQAHFRSYPDWQGSMDDHAQFFLTNPRYNDAFQYVADGERFAQAIAAAGYATDPSYARKVISIMRSHGLAQLDA